MREKRRQYVFDQYIQCNNKKVLANGKCFRGSHFEMSLSLMDMNTVIKNILCFTLEFLNISTNNVDYRLFFFVFFIHFADVKYHYKERILVSMQFYDVVKFTRRGFALFFFIKTNLIFHAQQCFNEFRLFIATKSIDLWFWLALLSNIKILRKKSKAFE